MVNVVDVLYRIGDGEVIVAVGVTAVQAFAPFV